MKKSTYGIVIAIVIIVSLVIVGIVIVSNNKKGKEGNSQVNNTQANIINNNTNINTNTNTNENSVQNTEVNANEVENQTSTETLDEEPKTATEKAISIVKKDWGNNPGEVVVEGLDENSNYIISVRDATTTQALAFYTVNTTDGTFTKRDM